MNDRALGGVLMVAAAGALAWAYFTGRLDGVITAFVAHAEGISARAGGPLVAGRRGRASSGLTTQGSQP